MDADKKIAVSIFAFVEFLRLLCEKINLVLFVDDLQWADSLFIRYINNLLNNSEVKIFTIEPIVTMKWMPPACLTIRSLKYRLTFLSS